MTPLADGRRIPVRLFVSDRCVDRYDRDQYEAGYAFEQALGDLGPGGDLRFVSNGRYAELDLDYAGLLGASCNAMGAAPPLDIFDPDQAVPIPAPVLIARAR